MLIHQVQTFAAVLGLRCSIALHQNPAHLSLTSLRHLQDYGAHISKLGIEPRHLPAYVELWNIVAPPDQQQEVAS